MSATERAESGISQGEAATIAAGLAATRVRYRWDVATAQYVDTVTNRVVSPVVVRNALDDAIDASSKTVRLATQQLREGVLDIQGWQRIMLAEIKNGHLAAVASATGGFENMTPSTYGRAGRAIRDQYTWLRTFAEEIASGKQKMDGTLLRRAAMYAESAQVP